MIRRCGKTIVIVTALAFSTRLEAATVTLDPETDNWLNSCRGAYDHNNGTDAELRVRTAALLFFPPPRDIKNSRSLLLFDVSDLPVDDSHIHHVILGLYYFEYGWDNPMGREYAVHRVTSSWDELGSTWQSRDMNHTPDPLYWENYHAGIPAYRPGGGDFDTNGYASVEVPDIGDPPYWNDPTWMTWDVTKLVLEWVNEDYPNEGLLIKDADEFEEDPGVDLAWGPAKFHSSDYGDDTLWPYLEVTYFVIWGDFEEDGDVDLEDFAHWDDCMTGPDDGPCEDNCCAFDFDRDNDVDLEDYAALQRAMGS